MRTKTQACGIRPGIETLDPRLMLAADTVSVLDLRSDIDNSGSVDFADFLLLSSEFGNSAASGDSVFSDINMDGKVFFDDFLQLSGSFGKDTNVPKALLKIKNDAASFDAALSLFGGLAIWDDIALGQTTIAIEVPVETTVGVRDEGVVCDLFGVLGDVESRCDLIFDGDPFSPNLGLESISLEEGRSYLAIIQDSPLGAAKPLQITVDRIA